MSATPTSNQTKAPILWTNVIVFASTFLIALIGVPLYGLYVGLGVEHLIATTLALGFAGMSITVGYHRLWSHRTYEAHPAIQFVLALGGAFALQNSALHWSSDHRIHHKFVDQNDKDPYSAKRGFWYSHIGWMLRDYQGEKYSDYSNCRDLQKNKIVMWQHKYYLPLALAMNFGIPLILGVIFNDIWGMLLTVGVLRLVLSHHFTFFINSLAHIWGKQTYTDKNTARDNYLLAFVTYGEGYHNYHHIFENDYRNGIRWYHFDPSKWFIKTLSFIGLTKNLRVVPEEKIKAAKWRMQKFKTEQKIIDLPNKDVVLAKLEHEYEALVSAFKTYLETRKAYLTAKKQKVSDSVLAELKGNYELLRKELKRQQKQWQRVLTQVPA
ncbi:fatty acid desaturase [Psychrosphaera ytuae]|uniref:Fatty acid desaturase n=1 Tax=Psychrosphaera ytuae TaxID=2820710 RepID=A0A975HHI2_9GAMM|nr:fatty acid desaturase [Psychrosphaera ytuae]QTH63150.1 fatty acid desaturase [Psychrosphaera ytuae]